MTPSRLWYGLFRTPWKVTLCLLLLSASCESKPLSSSSRSEEATLNGHRWNDADVASRLESEKLTATDGTAEAESAEIRLSNSQRPTPAKLTTKHRRRRESSSHRSRRDFFPAEGGGHLDDWDIAVLANNPGDLMEVNASRVRDHSKRQQSEWLAQATTMRSIPAAATTTAPTPVDVAPSQMCSPVTKTKKIVYRKGCTTKLRLSVCEGLCHTEVKLAKVEPFYSVRYSVCQMDAYDVITVRLQCKTQKARRRIGQDFIDLQFKNATACSCGWLT